MDERQILEPLVSDLMAIVNTINELLRSSGRLLSAEAREKLDVLSRQIKSKIEEFG